MKRRNFLQQVGSAALSVGVVGSLGFLSNCTSKATKESEGNTSSANNNKDLWFKLSLAQWSFHSALGFNETKSKTMDNLDFAAKAAKLGFEGVEYVSGFFADKAKDEKYLGEMKKRAADNNVLSLLIMIDGEGGLGSVDNKERQKAIENHYKWVEAAHFLGCHSIRVNAFGKGTAEEVGKAAVDGLSRLAEYGAKENINVIVENHGGYSSNGEWMANVMKEVNMKNCGMLPDFGNFCMKRDNGQEWGGNCLEEYDRYKGVELFMPYAKAVSAKSYDFDADGNETKIDYVRMLKIVKAGGYNGFIGVEYEGTNKPEEEGVLLTKALLEKAGRMV
jgi:sugar phosphate isomerase/epimerase